MTNGRVRLPAWVPGVLGSCVFTQEVRSIYDKEKDAFPYALTIRSNTTAESQNRRRKRCVQDQKDAGPASCHAHTPVF